MYYEIFPLPLRFFAYPTYTFTHMYILYIQYMYKIRINFSKENNSQLKPQTCATCASRAQSQIKTKISPTGFSTWPKQGL